MRRLLRIPEGQTRQGASATGLLDVCARVGDPVHPHLPGAAVPGAGAGARAGVGPAIGIPVGVVAIACNVMTIRRFWAADHRWRWAYSALSLTVIALLVVLMVRDIATLVG